MKQSTVQQQDSLQSVLAAYGLQAAPHEVIPFGSGLINHTWKINTSSGEFVLQRINIQVFKNPVGIDRNLQLLSQYLNAHHPDYLFVAPLPASDGNTLVHTSEGYFRLFSFVPYSHTVDVVQTPEQAFEAAMQFGRFTKLLTGFDATSLNITIPDFHNLKLRYQQLLHALEQGNPQRLIEAKELVVQLQAHANIVDRFEALTRNPEFKLRVMHHDTKISNVLFDESERGICVIDLDTVMPGFYISDVGDMMRTYLSPVSEEEQDFSMIDVREEFYQAIREGYLQEMGNELTPSEQAAFSFSGKFMVYMQALRFLTDYLNNDVYYGARYPEQNLVRAHNQLVLLNRLMEKYPG